MNLSLPEQLYVVQTIRWDYMVDGEGQGWYRYRTGDQGELVATFPDRDQADSHCAELEREKRAEVNPFEYGETLADLTPFDADRWHDWLLDAGLEPPITDWPNGRRDWVNWWTAESPAMTELQRAKVWQGLDRLRFFCVVELFAAENW